MDLAAVATQLAVRFGPTAITPPTGYDDVVLSTHLLPNALEETPAVIVFPPDITYNYPTRNRTGDATFPVRFYIAQTGSLAAATTAVYAWYSVLVEQLVGNMALGQAATGVTVVALSRGPTRIIFPDARQVLESGDVLALTGSHDALAAANHLLSGPGVEEAGGPT